MFFKKKNTFYYILISAFLLSLNSYSQTISLSDFANEIKKDKKKSGADKALKKEELKLFRDQQKGLAINVFGSLTGSSELEPTIDLFNASNSVYFNWIDDQKWVNKGLLKGYDIRISYTKESFLPFGIYGGYGSANLFLGNFTDNLLDDSMLPDKLIVTPSKSNYFVIGLSKNLSLSSTIYLGYVQFDDVERTDILQTTNIQESMGFNIGYTHRLKSLAISIDNILHLPYYKESVYQIGNKQNNDFTFGHRLQIGLGYIF